MPLPRSPLALLLVPPLIAGCAPSGSFPSLAVRPIESRGDSPPVAPPAAQVASDSALLAQVAELLAAARRGEAAFREGLPEARRAASAAGAAGSESWISAQQAISRLEAFRAPTVTALAELDALALARGRQPTNADDYRALLAAVEEAGGLAAAQREEIERLSGASGTP